MPTQLCPNEYVISWQVGLCQQTTEMYDVIKSLSLDQQTEIDKRGVGLSGD
ncbi:hypothetical protein ACO0LD_28510 [Undibacterium sp. Ji83W]|uniref:hypothetical protein n=1 Tax=Undibacterium sp. Ji83W TaxID=3413043 RepID=UPI003BF2B747